ncbi:hypothetical protein ACWIGW_13050 [Nocardia brasiliensis]
MLVAMVLAVAVGSILTLWLPGPVAASIGSAIAAAIFSIASPRAASLLERSAEEKESRIEQVVVADRKGRLQRIRDIDDPVALRVHPAEVLFREVGETTVLDRVPPYVPRDIDQQLRSAASGTGFVLLCGDSTAGKSRAAYEAIKAVLPDRVLIAPTTRDSIGRIVTLAEAHRRCVVWLDDLERFFGPGGLTPNVVGRILGDSKREVFILATMRSAEFERYSGISGRGVSDSEGDSLRDSRDVLERARVIHLSRRWTAEELSRAGDFVNDVRIRSALSCAGHLGLAEILASGPKLAQRWSNGWDPGGSPRGAALVAAAVDCRRAGLHEPQPLSILAELAECYLSERGGVLLRPEPIDDALSWATMPSFGASSLLLPAERAGHYVAFDYLIDLPGIDRVPVSTWETLIRRASPEQVIDVGDAARRRFQFDVAATAYRKAAECNVSGAELSLALVLTHVDQEMGLSIMARILLEVDQTLGSDSRESVEIRLKMAESLADSPRVAEAMELFPAIISDLDRLLGPRHSMTLDARRWFAYSVGSCGCDSTAIELLGQTLPLHEQVFGRDNLATLLVRHYLATFMGEQDPLTSLELLFDLKRDYTRLFGPDSPRVLQVRTLIAGMATRTRPLDEAVGMYRELAADKARVLGVLHNHTLQVKFCLAVYMAKSGDLESARKMIDSLLDLWYQEFGPGPAVSKIAVLILRSTPGGGDWRRPSNLLFTDLAIAVLKDCRGTADPVLVRLCEMRNARSVPAE